MKPPSDPKVASAAWLASAAIALLVITNLVWLIAYSALSAKVVGVAPAGGTVTPIPTAKMATPTPPSSGNITGKVGYPAGTAPAMSVCAVDTVNSDKKFCVDHAQGADLAYSLTVPVGSYYVYASTKQQVGSYTPSYKAYYDRFVTCGMTASCPSSGHTQYLPVAVTAGISTDGIDPTDWYAPI